MFNTFAGRLRPRSKWVKFWPAPMKWRVACCLVWLCFTALRKSSWRRVCANSSRKACKLRNKSITISSTQAIPTRKNGDNSTCSSTVTTRVYSAWTHGLWVFEMFANQPGQMPHTKLNWFPKFKKNTLILYNLHDKNKEYSKHLVEQIG